MGRGKLFSQVSLLMKPARRSALSGVRLHPGLLSRLELQGGCRHLAVFEGLCLPAASQAGACPATQTCTGCSCQALDQMCQPGGAGGDSIHGTETLTETPTS